MSDVRLPVLYSFRRCPYAMRARLAIAVAGCCVELREVVLRDKPPSMLEASPKGTVPVLILPDGRVLDESRDIMFWALNQNDPENWLAPWQPDRQSMEALFDIADQDFKRALDRYKYPGRYPEENVDPEEQRQSNLLILKQWDDKLRTTGWLFGGNCSVGDMFVLPFVRQFAHVDKAWFDAQDLPHVQKWLESFLNSILFKSIMNKYEQWQETEVGIPFPEAA